MFLSLVRKKEPELYRESLSHWSKQILDALANGVWFNEQKIRPVANIVVNGMGGSNLGPEIVKALFKKTLATPILIEPGYDVPGFVGKDTAYIVSSYSGTTEEPLIAYKKAKQRGALVIALTATGDNKLARMAKQDKVPLFQFPTKANLSGQPRIGLGAALTGFILVLAKLGLIKNATLKELEKAAKKFSRSPKIIEAAKHLARLLKNREIVSVAGATFEGNLKTLRNQLCESGKNFGQYLLISDMNHFALEGLGNPSSNGKRLGALFIESKLYDAKISKRLELTKEIFRQHGIAVVSQALLGKTLLEQGIELLQFSNYLSYYVSINNRVDPMNIPSVDWFKKKLSN